MSGTDQSKTGDRLDVAEESRWRVRCPRFETLAQIHCFRSRGEMHPLAGQRCRFPPRRQYLQSSGIGVALSETCNTPVTLSLFRVIIGDT